MGDRWAVHHGDCREVMQEMEAESVDSIVSDPPYGLSFMGKGWDHGVPGVEFWKAALRVAKPGCHLLAFGGTRTFHRLTVAIEDAGWEVRDCLGWLYGSGFPKSHDVSKAIDREAGAKRETVLIPTKAGNTRGDRGATYATETHAGFRDISIPQTDAARQWQGWGTALKPAWEPIILARKPLSGTVAANVLEYGTGALNVDGCRVGTEDDTSRKTGALFSGMDKPGGIIGGQTVAHALGRWPANLIHDGSDEVVGLFPQAKSPAGSTIRGYGTYKTVGGASNHRPCHDSGLTRESVNGYGDSGSAARFFYCAKASKRDRDEGCEGLEERAKKVSVIQTEGVGLHGHSEDGKQISKARNHHPTVKPTDLMRYLCRLITPPDGLVFDPFTGSGSTGKAAMLEGFRFVGAELSPEYIEIARARIGHAAGRTRQKELALA